VKNNYCAYVSKGLRLSFLEKDGVDNVRTSPCCHLHYDYIDDKIQKFSALEDIDSVLSHQMRKYFIDYFKNNDTLHPACATCIHHEKNGVKSVRQKFNELDKENKDFDFLKLDVIIGNLCNLACPFCNQGSSSLIEQISSKYNQSKLPFHWNDAHKNNRASPKITGQVCAELLKKYNIYSFKIVGGEPFLKENWQPIAEVLDQNLCKDLHLEVTTNGTVMNQSVLDGLSKVKSSYLRISVDSIGHNYNFIRWPHNWNKMQKNLFLLRDCKPNNCDYKVSILINLFNFELLPDIERFFINNNLNFSLDFTLKPNNSPLQWTNLPFKIKHSVYKKIKNKEAKQLIQTDLEKKPVADLKSIKKDIKFYLRQRNMNAEDVIGQKTVGWLCL
jgi:MoaA/NifB/PqqE/SkfB family radical SAM enzyme